MISPLFLVLTGLAARGTAISLVQGMCVNADPALHWLQAKLSNNSAICRRGDSLQLQTPTDTGESGVAMNASVVVCPDTAQDVSYAAGATHWPRCGKGFAFVGGAHSQISASSRFGFVMDLSWMSCSRVIRAFADPAGGNPFAAIEYEGAANWGQVQAVTNGTGCTANADQAEVRSRVPDPQWPRLCQTRAHSGRMGQYL